MKNNKIISKFINKIKTMNKSKLFMIICISILCISVVGTTVAYYSEELFTSNNSTIIHGLDYYINYNKGRDVSGATLLPTSTYSEGISSEIEFWKKDNTYDIYGHIYIDINEIGTNLSNSSALKYTLVSNNTIVAEGSIKLDRTGNSILVAANIPLELNKQLYTIYIWLDENEYPDTGVSSEALSLSVRCEATMKPINDVTPLSNFQYILGSETPVVDHIDWYHEETDAYYEANISPINLASNEVLLMKYIGTDKNVDVPDTYIVNGTAYNVVMASEIYYFDYIEEIDAEPEECIGVFQYNENIESVNLGQNIKLVMSNYEYYDSELIYTVENSAYDLFFHCTSLVNVPVIPSSVTDMSYTFYRCTNLTGTVRINASNVTSVSNLFYGTTKEITVEVPAGSTTYTNISNLSATAKPSTVTLVPIQ